MSWTLEDVKDHLGITDPNQDAEVEAAMRVSMAFVERYCNRLFEYRADYSEYVRHVRGEGVQMHLWPFKGDITAKSQSGEIIATWPYMSHPLADPIAGGTVYPEQGHWADSQTGIVWWKSYRTAQPLFFRYEGGYAPDEWPADLYYVLMNTVKNAFGLQAGGSTLEAGAISKMTVPDVGTITYASGDTGGGSVGGGGSLGPIAGADTMILDLYRLNEC